MISAQDQTRLSALSAKFSSFRKERRSPRQRLPFELWEEAVMLARELTPSVVAKALPVDLATLNAKLNRRAKSVGTCAPKQTIVQLGPTAAMPRVNSSSRLVAASPGALALELTQVDGRRLCLRGADAMLVSEVVRTFLLGEG